MKNKINSGKSEEVLIWLDSAIKVYLSYFKKGLGSVKTLQQNPENIFSKIRTAREVIALYKALRKDKKRLTVELKKRLEDIGEISDRAVRIVSKLSVDDRGVTTESLRSLISMLVRLQSGPDSEAEAKRQRVMQRLTNIFRQRELAEIIVKIRAANSPELSRQSAFLTNAENAIKAQHGQENPENLSQFADQISVGAQTSLRDSKGLIESVQKAKDHHNVRELDMEHSILMRFEQEAQQSSGNFFTYHQRVYEYLQSIRNTEAYKRLAVLESVKRLINYNLLLDFLGNSSYQDKREKWHNGMLQIIAKSESQGDWKEFFDLAKKIGWRVRTVRGFGYPEVARVLENMQNEEMLNQKVGLSPELWKKRILMLIEQIRSEAYHKRLMQQMIAEVQQKLGDIRIKQRAFLDKLSAIIQAEFDKIKDFRTRAMHEVIKIVNAKAAEFERAEKNLRYHLMKVKVIMIRTERQEYARIKKLRTQIDKDLQLVRTKIDNLMKIFSFYGQQHRISDKIPETRHRLQRAAAAQERVASNPIIPTKESMIDSLANTTLSEQAFERIKNLLDEDKRSTSIRPEHFTFVASLSREINADLKSISGLLPGFLTQKKKDARSTSGRKGGIQFVANSSETADVSEKKAVGQSGFPGQKNQTQKGDISGRRR